MELQPPKARLNSGTIEFYEVGQGVGRCQSTNGCYVSRPFTVTYVDHNNDTWQLDVGTGYWAR